jgi:hypothetical protein
MKKSLFVLGLCLVLILGATGCDDDDLAALLDVPVDQQVSAVTSGVLTGINALTGVGVAISNAVPSQTAANGSLGGPICTDVSTVLCDGGGFGEVCLLGLTAELDLVDCNNLLAGVELDNIDPFPAVSIDLLGTSATVKLRIDNSLEFDGTISIVAPALGQCFASDWNLFISDADISSNAVGSISQCLNGAPDGFLDVDSFDLNLEMEYSFDGQGGGVIDVFELDSGNFLAVCSFDIKSETVDCNTNPTN